MPESKTLEFKRDTSSKRRYLEPTWEELGTVLRVTFFPHPEVAQGPSGTKSGPSRDQVNIGTGNDKVAGKMQTT